MKKYLYLLMTSVVLSFVSCGSDDEDPVPSSLQVSQTSVSFSADGGSTSIIVTSNTTWNITGGDNWLTVTKSSNAINLSAQKNESTEGKKTAILVKTDDGSLSQTIEVSISGAKQETASIVGIWKHSFGRQGGYTIKQFNSDETGFSREYDPADGGWHGKHEFTYKYDEQLKRLYRYNTSEKTETYEVRELTNITLTLYNITYEEGPDTYVRITEKDVVFPD